MGKNAKLNLKSGFYRPKYDWCEDEAPRLSYGDSIIYCLHVRGFTKHSSSHVKHKGTFLGIQEKIDYIKDLGVTTLELMPAYEFCEYEDEQDKFTMEYQVNHIDEKLPKKDDETVINRKCNYWGFKKAYYMAPKSGFAATSDPSGEFKDLIKALHKEGLELVMQFYFPNDCKQGYILEVLKHWVLEYHVDGFHLLGKNIPVTLLATDPLFTNVKLMYENFPVDEIYASQEMPAFKNLGYYRSEFMQDTRRFLKGDADMLRGFLFHVTNHNDKCGVVNYIANYDGFSLMDLVSYDRKHNEENGEGNQDGTEYNYSWNCGIEGPTKKKQVLTLRQKQLKNALIFLLCSQGTPMLTAGDEFGHSRKGNNNCYCLDNDSNWLDWNLIKKHKELFDFTKELIAFRKEKNILHKENALSNMDRFGSGYPEVSFHGEEAWKAGTENYLHHVAVLLYDSPKKDKPVEALYIAYNMHWEVKVFDVPTLPKDTKWSIKYKTDADADIKENENGHVLIKVPPRSIVILEALGEKRG